MPEDKLTLKFDPGTIEHLGIKMYSQLPHALAELVANAYDADASKVSIKLYDADPQNKKIIIEDDGVGMSRNEVQNKFLIIGRNRRPDDANRTTTKGRAITGRKGLGKLALFGIGNNISIETSQKNEPTKTWFSMNWKQIIGKAPVENNNRQAVGGLREYNPAENIIKKNNPAEHGTIITLTELKRESNFNLMDVAVSLSKMFNVIGPTFQVVLEHNDDAENAISLSRELRYDGMEHEFTWNVERDIIPNINSGDYEYKNQVKGWIVSSPEGRTMPNPLRGITLYVNGRLANTPDFFGLGQTPHAFSYLSGWIDADFLDEFQDEDLIATDRQSLSWDLPEAEKLQTFLQKIVRYVENAWLEGRKAKKQKANSDKAGVDLARWYGSLPNIQMKEHIEHIINTVSENANVDSDEYARIVKKLHNLVPDYPDYFYRNLNSSIKNVARNEFDNEDYHSAIVLSLVKYVEAITNKLRASGIDVANRLKNERSRIEHAFGQGGLYQVAHHFRKLDGSEFDPNAIDGLEDAQKLLSAGLWTGYRHPLCNGHGNPQDIKDAGIITRQNCLDALSILSMLFDRFDDAKDAPPKP